MMKPSGLQPGFDLSKIEAGCDEAGRGCLAGPVFAAAVILPVGFSAEGLNDSKKLTARARDHFRLIIEEGAVAWAVAMADQEEIDRVNILHASILAMHRAIRDLKVVPGHLLIDGNRFTPYAGIPHRCIVRGDSTFLNIAAASILAKTHRDEYMQALHLRYPQYEWNRNKGYPTPAHRRAIHEHGLSEFHRRSFRSSWQLPLFK